MAKQTGLVISAHGRHFMVRLDASNEILHCYPKGKKSEAAVGDTVFITLSGDKQAVITGVSSRKNLFYRSDASRSKQFAANIDQILLVVAVEPEFSLDLLGRALVAAKSAEIDFRVILNKADLPGVEAAHTRLVDVISLQVPVISLSALDINQTNSLLKPVLADKTTLLLGQSGMGKSSLLNALIPDAMAATNEFSSALGAGKHTTTHTRLYDLPFGGHLIDSPGFQAFGLQHLNEYEIQLGFPEFTDFIEQCKFYNCKHLQEPNCGILNAVATGQISQNRYDLYKRIVNENAANKRY